jgi:hypothetical protein
MTEEYTRQVPLGLQANAARLGAIVTGGAGFPAEPAVRGTSPAARAVHRAHRASAGCQVRVPASRSDARRCSHARHTRVTISTRRPNLNRSIMGTSVTTEVDR